MRNSSSTSHHLGWGIAPWAPLDPGQPCEPLGAPHSLQGTPHTAGAHQARWLHFAPPVRDSPMQKMRTKLASVTEEPLLTMLTRNWKNG